ncbi:MAG: hypothetical protein JSS81_22550 [Acidobacteria bacterium]|nr:hypothetical protein [Acidobacteriota bacterium]
MKKLILVIPFLMLTGCTINMGGANTAATPTPANNTAANKDAKSDGNAPGGAKPTASPAAKTESEAPKKAGADDPKSEEEQIQFAKGATETTLERTIAPGVDKMYLMNAKKGQVLFFKVTESTKQLAVDFDKNPVGVGEEVRQVLNASGDWAIYVSNPTDKPLKYTLWVGIE